MLCPYCTSQISEQALVCPVCTRDLYLFKPLREKIEYLETSLNDAPAVRALEARIATLENELAELRSGAAAAPAAPAAAEIPLASTPRNFFSSTLIAFLIPMLLMLAAHFAIVIMYDLKPLYLRLASLLIPLPFGFALFVWHPRRFAASAIIAFATAVVTVLGMSAITGAADNTPVLPQNLRETREMIEYATSIAFAFITGMLLGRWRCHRTRRNRQPSRIVMFLAQLLTSDADGQLGLQKMIAPINKIVAALTPMVTAGIAIYTGLKAFLAN